MKTIEVKILPDQPFYHVVHKTTYPIVTIKCFDCDGTGKTLAGNKCLYCHGQGGKTSRDMSKPTRGWFYEKKQYDRLVWWGGDEITYESDSYCCGETETDTFYPSNCFLTEEEAKAEVEARTARDNNG